MEMARPRIQLFALAVLMAAAGTSNAHVTVLPREAPVKASQEFAVRVPNEREVPTESVRLQFPPELEIVRLKPMAGWTSEIERDDKGKIIGVTWAGGKIGREEYLDFYLVAKLPEQPGTIRIRAYQNYVGGVQVAWVNDKDPQPAPTITVTAAPVAASPENAAAGDPAVETKMQWMGPLSLALSVVALIVALRSGRRRAG